jgi:phage tail-like protein
MTGDRKGTSPSRRKFNFVVDIDGVGIRMHFQEVSGLDAESALAEYRAGRSEGISSRRSPGIVKPGSVTLKRGTAVKDAKLSAWHAQIQQSSARRATVRITLLDERGSSVAVWTLDNAFPRKFTGPDLNATANDVAIETIELEHEGLTIVTGSP